MRGLAVLVIATLVACAGCGFHLRGQRVVDIGIARVHVTQQQAYYTAAELQKRLG